VALVARGQGAILRRAMSRENVEAFRRALAAYNRREVEPMVEVTHPEIEWYPLSAEVEGSLSFRGHEGLRQWFANLHATYRGVRGEH
jgi:ketosteroid isomerase-like protein